MPFTVENMTGQIYYVANPPTGSDSNNGSQGAPFATFFHAMDMLFASAGPRTVLFRRGDTFGAVWPDEVGVGSGFDATQSGYGHSGPYLIGAYGDGTDNPKIQNPLFAGWSFGYVVETDQQ